MIFATSSWKDEKLLVDFVKMQSTDGIGMMANASCICVSVKSSSMQLLGLFSLPMITYWQIKKKRFLDQSFGGNSCPVLASLVGNQTPVITAKNPH